MDYEKLTAEARKNIAMFGKWDDVGPFELLETAFIAIKSGIMTDDWDYVAEGQVMLEKIIEKYEPVRVKVPGREKKKDTAFLPKEDRQ